MTAEDPQQLHAKNKEITNNNKKKTKNPTFKLQMFL
jgi:hypothetical protein